MGAMQPQSPLGGRSVERRGDSLADVLERVLDKGVVIAGDIRVELLDIELLTIRIRLLISSADKAEELGMAWWRNDPFYTGVASGEQDGSREQGPSETDEVLRRLADSTDELLRRVAALEPGSDGEADEPAAAEDASTEDASAQAPSPDRD